MAGRILGMGDVVTLVEKAQEQFDAEQSAQLQEKMQKGIFTLEDFLQQMRQMRKMGPMKQIMKLIPGMGQAMDQMAGGEDEIQRMEAIILSMTPEERRNPDVIEASRRRRIARGSGTQPQDVSGLVKQFGMVAGMMKQMSGMGMRDRMRAIQQMGQMGAGGAPVATKVKQRSSRKKKQISKKEKAKRRKNRKR
jgi:signal recognition particle subunit SRP54